MNTFHSLVPVILLVVQLISQVRCVDLRRGIHRPPHRLHKLPLVPPHHPYPPSDNSYPNYPPYNPFMPPFAMDPYRIPPASTYQPPAPFGFMPNMQPAFPFSKFPNQYQPATPSEYAAEEPAEDFSAPSSESTYMTPSTPPGYMLPNPPPGYMPNPQASYTSPSSLYTPSNPSSSSSPSPSSLYMPSNPSFSYTSSSSYMPSTFPSSYPSPSYMAPQYFTPSSQPSYTFNPPSSFAMSSSPSYFAPSPQPGVTSTLPSYMPAAPQSAFPTSQASYISPNPAVQPQSPQTYVTPNVPPQALPGFLANQTSVLSAQQIPALSTTCGITFDNSTIIPGSVATDNSTQINSTMPPSAAVNQPGDLSENAMLLNSQQGAVDETPVISSNGETSTDMNSLPPQVKEFIDMIPNILAMPDSQAMTPNDQMQPPAEGKSRPSPFSLHKFSKKRPLQKHKLPYSPSAYYPSYPAPGYPAPPYPPSPYQPQLPLSVPSY